MDESTLVMDECKKVNDYFDWPTSCQGSQEVGYNMESTRGARNAVHTRFQGGR